MQDNDTAGIMSLVTLTSKDAYQKLPEPQKDQLLMADILSTKLTPLTSIGVVNLLLRIRTLSKQPRFSLEKVTLLREGRSVVFVHIVLHALPSLKAAFPMLSKRQRML